jgi:hypothetical protein
MKKQQFEGLSPSFTATLSSGQSANNSNFIFMKIARFANLAIRQTAGRSPKAKSEIKNSTR